jgi:aldehyde reductase
MASTTLNPKSSIKLNSGYEIPVLGLGTWLSKPGEVGRAVIEAFDIGYRHFDCARIYQNEAEIGQSLSEILSKGKAKREELFITSKVWNTFHSYQKAGECIDASLKDLQLSYLDMCLIHWPMGFFEGGDLFPKDKNEKLMYSDVDFLDTWKALEDAVTAGKVKSIGLSNFNKDQIERVLKACRIKPSNLQIECHPYFPQRDLIKFCHDNGIAVTAYSPLANNANTFSRKEDSPNLLSEPVLAEIGQKHSKTPAQVIIRWALQRNTIVIPKSVSKNRLQENFDVFNFNLSEQEMTKVDNLNRNWRMVALERDLTHPYYPFHAKF